MAKIHPIFWGKVVDGKLTVHHKRRFQEYLNALKGEVEITIKPYRRTRSLNQNAYYWSVVVAILAEHFGYEDEELHEALKLKFLYKPHAKLPTVRSTAALDIAEFSEYVEKVRRWAAEEKVIIPDPNEVEI